MDVAVHKVRTDSGPVAHKLHRRTELVAGHARMGLKMFPQSLLADIRFALRQFRLSSVFTLMTLALGIGGTTALFSLIYAVMLRSLPIAIRPASIVSVRATTAESLVAARRG